jgi:hypothetical protein
MWNLLVFLEKWMVTARLLEDVEIWWFWKVGWLVVVLA